MEGKTEAKEIPKAIVSSSSDSSRDLTNPPPSKLTQPPQASTTQPPSPPQPSKSTKKHRRAAEGQATGPGTGYCGKCGSKCNGDNKTTGLCPTCSGKRKNQKAKSAARCVLLRQMQKLDLEERKEYTNRLEEEIESLKAQLDERNQLVYKIRSYTKESRGLSKIRRLLETIAPENEASGMAGQSDTFGGDLKQGSEERSRQLGGADDSVRKQLSFFP